MLAVCLSAPSVAVMGEFGPHAEKSPPTAPAARPDHWNFCYSLLLARPAAIKAGSGPTAPAIASAPFPQSQPNLVPADIIATIYRCLGIPAEFENPRPTSSGQRPSFHGATRSMSLLA